MLSEKVKSLFSQKGYISLLVKKELPMRKALIDLGIPLESSFAETIYQRLVLLLLNGDMNCISYAGLRFIQMIWTMPLNQLMTNCNSLMNISH